MCGRVLSESRQLELHRRRSLEASLGQASGHERLTIQPGQIRWHGPISENVPPDQSSICTGLEEAAGSTWFPSAMASARRGFNERLGGSNPPRIVSVGVAWARFIATAITVSLVGPCGACTQADSISSTLFIHTGGRELPPVTSRERLLGAQPQTYALPRFSPRPARGRAAMYVVWYPSACSSVRAWLRWGAPITAVSESDRGRVDFVGICPRLVAGGEARLGADAAPSEPSRTPIVRGHVLVRMWQGLRGAHV